LLPIELKSISAFNEGDSVVFQWVTAMEKNNSGFQIQWSNNGKNWNNSSFIPGKGNASFESHYRWTHALFDLPQQFYLRYQQIDYDGRTSNSPVFPINNSSYFQPWTYSETQGLSFLSKQSGKLSFQILDYQGKNLNSTHWFVDKNQPLIFSTQQLKPGLYFIQATFNNQPTQFKFVKR
jgi:hypothetical protein